MVVVVLVRARARGGAERSSEARWRGCEEGGEVGALRSPAQCSRWGVLCRLVDSVGVGRLGDGCACECVRRMGLRMRRGALERARVVMKKGGRGESSPLLAPPFDGWRSRNILPQTTNRTRGAQTRTPPSLTHIQQSEQTITQRRKAFAARREEVDLRLSLLSPPFFFVRTPCPAR
jgi:hypothetical protein